MTLPNERTTRSDVVAVAEELEGLVVAAGRNAARPLVNFLRSQRLNVQLLTEGESAFEEALIHPPDVILIDDAVGPAGGIELCQRLKNNSRTHFVPVIVWAPQDDRQVRLRAYSVGADAVFAPSIDAQERRTRLWALLRSHSLYRRQEQRRLSQASELSVRRRWMAALLDDLQQKLVVATAAAERTRDGAGGDECAAVVRDLSDGVRAVLTFDHAQTGRLRFEDLEIDLDALLAEVVAGARPHATRLHKAVQLGQPDGRGRVASPLVVRGDPALLRLALESLVSDALHHPLNGRVSVAVETTGNAAQPRHPRLERSLSGDRREELTEPADPRVSVSVRGDGVAFAPGGARDPAQLFEPFARRVGGAPLAQAVGLALAQSLIELHGGALAPDGNGFVFDLRVGTARPIGTPAE